VSNTLWAVASMQQQMPEQHLHRVLFRHLQQTEQRFVKYWRRPPHRVCLTPSWHVPSCSTAHNSCYQHWSITLSSCRHSWQQPYHRSCQT
jgi:hypothetical protein